MSEQTAPVLSDPTGFPCPHRRVREYRGEVDRTVRPAQFVQEGVCLVCGYGVHRAKSAQHVGAFQSRRDPFTPWSVYPGSERDPLVVRRQANR